MRLWLPLKKRDGCTLTYIYDALDRKTVSGACVAGCACTTPPVWSVRNVYYGYGARGQQTSVRFDSTGGTDAVVNVYDGFGRLTSSTVSMGGISRTVGRQYDVDGNRIRVTHPDTNYFTYDYDGLDRMSVLKQNGVTQVSGYATSQNSAQAPFVRTRQLLPLWFQMPSRGLGGWFIGGGAEGGEVAFRGLQGGARCSLHCQDRDRPWFLPRRMVTNEMVAVPENLIHPRHS